MSMSGCIRNAVLATLLMGISAPARSDARHTVPRDIHGLIEAGRLAEAKVKLYEFRRKEPDNPLAIFYLARIESDRNLARALYREVERFADPVLASEAVFARAEMYFEEEEFREAEALLLQAISMQTSGEAYAAALYKLGAICFKEGGTEEALKRFIASRDACSDDFRRTLACAGILECHIARQEWKQALDAAREALDGRDETSALTPRVLEAVALAWRKLGNEENAEKFTRRLMNDFPRSYQAYAIRTRGGRIGEESMYSPGSTSFGAAQPRPSTEKREAPASETVENQIGGGYSVQAGAFADRLNALKIHNRLRDSGFPVRIDMRTVDGKHFFLVRVGMYRSRGEAEEIESRVSKIIGTRAVVVMVE